MSEEQRLGGNWADPHDLLIVGLDDLPEGLNPKAVDDLSDPERLTPPLEGLIESIMTKGVAETVTVREHKLSGSHGGKRLRVVVNGRQRVMAARIANKRLAKVKDGHPVRVPYVLRTYEGDAAYVVRLGNEFRKTDGPLAKARNAAALLARGYSEEECRKCFEVDGAAMSRGTLRNLLSLLKLPPDTQAALAAGQIGLTTGYELAKADDATVEAVTKAATNGAKPPKASEVRPDKPRRVRNGGSSRPSPSQLSALLEQFEPSEKDIEDGSFTEAESAVYGLLSWIVTGDLEVLEDFPDILKDVKKVCRPSKNMGEEVL